jgi:hypothetical protein
MTVTISPVMNDLRLQAVLDYLNTGGTPAVDFYTTPRPANGAIPSGTLLGTIDLPSPCAALVSHSLVFVCPQDGMVAVTGTVSWCRFRNGSDNFVMDADVTLAGDGGDVIVSSLIVYLGGTLRLVSGVIG